MFLKTEELLIEGKKHTIIVISITNEDYDETQGKISLTFWN